MVAPKHGWRAHVVSSTALAPHPEMGDRSCLALHAVVKRYDAGRVDVGCRRALEIGAATRLSVLAILRRGPDRVARDVPDAEPGRRHADAGEAAPPHRGGPP